MYLAVYCTDNRFDQRKAKPNTRGLIRFLSEWFVKFVLEVCWRDALARVRHCQNAILDPIRLRNLLFELDMNKPSVRIFESIAHQIHDDATNGPWLAPVGPVLI